jgi:hypothetical protein
MKLYGRNTASLYAPISFGRTAYTLVCCTPVLLAFMV